MAVRDDFTAGEVLAAADLNDTFASKPPFAYGTATPTTTTSGFLWYDTNNSPPIAKYWNGSAFSLQSGLTLIVKDTFSAVSSVSINGCFSSTFRAYKVIVSLGAASASTTLRLRYRVSGSDESSNIYFGSGQATTWGGTSAVRFNDNPSTSHAINSIATLQSLNIFDCYDPANGRAQLLGHFQTAGGSDWSGYFGGYLNTNSTYTGLSVFPATGTITGSIQVYGYGD
jgi:hypothetical protein